MNDMTNAAGRQAVEGKGQLSRNHASRSFLYRSLFAATDNRLYVNMPPTLSQSSLRSPHLFRLRLAARTTLLQETPDLLEARSLPRLKSPALRHQLVQARRADVRPLQVGLAEAGAVAGQPLDDGGVGEVCQRLKSTPGQDLPQSHRERPDVTAARQLLLKHIAPSEA